MSLNSPCLFWCLDEQQVEFFATYVADVMTSSVKTTQDLAWTVCFFLSGDFLLDLEEYHETGGSWQVCERLTYGTVYVMDVHGMFMHVHGRCMNLSWTCMKAFGEIPSPAGGVR